MLFKEDGPSSTPMHINADVSGDAARATGKLSKYGTFWRTLHIRGAML